MKTQTHQRFETEMMHMAKRTVYSKHVIQIELWIMDSYDIYSSIIPQARALLCNKPEASPKLSSMHS